MGTRLLLPAVMGDRGEEEEITDHVRIRTNSYKNAGGVFDVAHRCRVREYAGTPYPFVASGGTCTGTRTPRTGTRTPVFGYLGHETPRRNFVRDSRSESVSHG